PGVADLPADPVEDLASLAFAAAGAGRSLKIVLPDDEWLGALSQTLDLAVRPLCLLLPDADFAAGIAARATLSLLKSRIAREAEEPDAAVAAAWQRQRLRLREFDEAWQRCQAWAAAGRGDDWPGPLGRLFPILVAGPRRSMQDESPADWLVLAGEDAWPQAPAARRLILRVSGRRGGTPRAVGREDRLRQELETLAREVGELELELATAQGELEPFSRRYYEVVGSRMVELDALQAKLAGWIADRQEKDDFAREAGGDAARRHGREQAREAQERAERSQREFRRYRETARDSAPEPQFRPSGDLKRLFRRIAQRIHPDRGRDDDDRAWRTRLMAEANRAYRRGDRAGLEEILALWEEGGGASPASARDGGAELEAQVMRLRSRLAEIQREMEAVFSSRLYELFQAARLAERQGRDLLQEMANRLDAEIAAIRVRLDELS
ncbi:MAG: hypothetical protein JNM82_14745, partial [Rhodocyclaceae bacterium]|nr:hypothetical protein [Rhodocyclaceae bacterium]